MGIVKDNGYFLPYMESFWPKSVKSGKDNEDPAKIMVAKIMGIDCINNSEKLFPDCK
jgi:hypothetical protein